MPWIRFILITRLCLCYIIDIFTLTYIWTAPYPFSRKVSSRLADAMQLGSMTTHCLSIYDSHFMYAAAAAAVAACGWGSRKTITSLASDRITVTCGCAASRLPRWPWLRSCFHRRVFHSTRACIPHRLNDCIGNLGRNSLLRVRSNVLRTTTSSCPIRVRPTFYVYIHRYLCCILFHVSSSVLSRYVS